MTIDNWLSLAWLLARIDLNTSVFAKFSDMMLG